MHHPFIALAILTLQLFLLLYKDNFFFVAVVRRQQKAIAVKCKRNTIISFDFLPWVVYSLGESHSVGLDTVAGHTFVPRGPPELGGPAAAEA